MDNGPLQRDYSLDNIRSFLMFMVVFAHFLGESSPFTWKWDIYRSIYVFHMPLFIFLFGYNINHSPKRLIFRWVIPYFVFQSLYLIFAVYVVEEKKDFQYTTPYWILWYMLACIYYQFLLLIYDTSNRKKQFVFLGCAFSFSLIIGYIDSVGYYMSLSRFFVFQPWFLLGYYCRKNGILEKMIAGRNRRVFVLFFSLLIIVLCFPFYTLMPNKLLYGSCSYASCSGTLWMRVIMWLVVCSWILFLFVGVKPGIERPLSLITRIGQNTWPIFILHGFAVKLIAKFCPGMISTSWKVLLVTVITLLVAGNKAAGMVVHYISFAWLEMIFTGRKSKLHREVFHDGTNQLH